MKTDRVIELTRLIEQRMTELEGIKSKAQGEQRHLTDEERAKYASLMDDVKIYTEELKLEQRELEIRGTISETQVKPIKPETDHRDERQRMYPGLPPEGQRFESFGENIIAAVNACRPGGMVDRRLKRAILGTSEASPTDGGLTVTI